MPNDIYNNIINDLALLITGNTSIPNVLIFILAGFLINMANEISNITNQKSSIFALQS